MDHQDVLHVRKMRSLLASMQAHYVVLYFGNNAGPQVRTASLNTTVCSLNRADGLSGPPAIPFHQAGTAKGAGFCCRGC